MCTVKKENEMELKLAEMRMIRCMCCVKGDMQQFYRYDTAKKLAYLVEYLWIYCTDFRKLFTL